MRIDTISEKQTTFIDQNEKQENTKEKQEKSTDKGEGMYAGDFAFSTNRIQQERDRAQKIAWNLIEAAFSGDKKIDEEVETRNQHARELQEENAEHQEKLKDVANERKMLEEEYNIHEDSQEAKDLELLRKGKEAEKNPSIELTDEEKEKITELKKSMTYYQREMLRLDDVEADYKKRIEKNEENIVEEYAIVRGIGIERLKGHDMVDAQKNAEQVKAAVSKEIIGMMMEDVQNKIDSDMEEQKAEAEKKKEEAEKLEERIEKAKEKEKEDDLEELYELDSIMDNVQKKKEDNNLPDVKKSLTQVVNELKLTAEDVKGLVVDSEL